MRFTKEITQGLIQFAKKVTIHANVFQNQQSKSAFEFCRQISSPNLEKMNPRFEVELKYFDEEDRSPQMIAEYTDGSIIDLDTSKYTCQDLRKEFFTQCQVVEETSEPDDKDTQKTFLGWNIYKVFNDEFDSTFKKH